MRAAIRSGSIRHLVVAVVPLLAAVSAVGCLGARDRGVGADTQAIRHTDSATIRPGDRPAAPPVSPVSPSESDTQVRSAEVPPATVAICDSVSTVIRQTLGISAHREDGAYRDMPRGVPRIGCRLRVIGPYEPKSVHDGAVTRIIDGMSVLETAFLRHSWRQDLRYSADGPNGSDVGVRSRDQLCMVSSRGELDDEEDTTVATVDPARAKPTAIDSVNITVECARDVASNDDAGVPDSLWSIARRAGLDSLYAISVSVQYPPYLEGDFDGDGIMDAAVLVEQRASGKLGVAIVRRGPREVAILAAGSESAGPDDLGEIADWSVFRKGTTFDLNVRGRPTQPLVGDALWIMRGDSSASFYLWSDHRFVHESRPGK